MCLANLDKAEYVVIARLGKRRTRIKELKLKNACKSDKFGTDLLDELTGRRSSATRCDEIVDYENFIAGFDCILVNLKRVGTVFELIANRIGITRKLSRLASGNEACTQFHGNRHADDEAARFRADNLGDSSIAKMVGNGYNGLSETIRIGEKRRDVFENDAGLGIVGNIDDKGLEVEIGH